MTDKSNLPEVKLPTTAQYHHISFSDNGIGFEPHFSQRIFEVFQRLHGGDVYPGTGIGLAICKKVVENHSGLITAEGVPDKGATFHIFLPAES
jgi:signal transduction histidine kinase